MQSTAIKRTPIAFIAKHVRAHWPLWVILVLYTVVAALYGVITPIFEGSDEPAHFEYVQALTAGHGLPLLDLGRAGANYFEAHQPPLYYATAAAATFWIDTSDAGEIGQENPHRVFNALALTNRNLFVHTRAEALPYQGTTLALHVARLVSLLFGAGALIGTYGLARSLFPARPEVWAGATAFVAFLPQFDFVAAMVSNDSVVICLAALGLWQLARVAAPLSPGVAVRARELILLGVLLGLAALSKDSGVLLLPFALLVLLPLLWARRGWRSVLRAGFSVTVVSLLVGGWWYVLRHAVLGYWLGTPVSAAEAKGLLGLGDLLAQWQEIEISFWGLFGWTIVPMPQPVYDALHWATALALAGLALFVLRRGAKGRETVGVAALLLWSLLVLAAFARWVSATDQPHGRLLFPALPAFGLLVCLGLSQFMPRRLRPALLSALGSALCLTSLWSALVVLPGAYPQPNYVAAGTPIPNPIGANLSNQIALLGYDWHTVQQAGHDVLVVDVYWKATGPIDDDYTVTVQAFEPNGRRVGQLDTYPVSAMHPTSDWQVGEVVRDEYPMELAASAAPPLKVMIGMYDLTTGKALQVIEPDGQRAGRVTIADVQIPDISK